MAEQTVEHLTGVVVQSSARSAGMGATATNGGKEGSGSYVGIGVGSFGLSTGVEAPETAGVVPAVIWRRQGELVFCGLNGESLRCDADTGGPRAFSFYPALAGAPRLLGFGLGTPDEKEAQSDEK